MPVSGRYIMHTVGMFSSDYARCVGCGGMGMDCWSRGVLQDCLLIASEVLA